MVKETTSMENIAQKRPETSPIKAAGRTIRSQASASNSTRMSANITATGRMANATVRV